jgi:hypothetical protein
LKAFERTATSAERSPRAASRRRWISREADPFFIGHSLGAQNVNHVGDVFDSRASAQDG